ncbi:MAG: sigma-54 dependent DNA-binding response regulator [Myxococcales bacterium]|nr:sigma-54 dependent DNA-binding response regulator [Myxococcales bacterium]
MLVVEDDAPLRRILSSELRDRDYGVTDVGTVAAACAALSRRPFDLVLTDLALAEGSGLDVLAHAREDQPGVPVVFLTGRGTIDDAVRAMKAGAFDFLQKPLDLERLVLAVEKATEAGLLQREALLFRRARALKGQTRPMVGASAVMRLLEDQIARLAPTDTTALIVGESGTGKELVARALHETSTRAQRPFVAVDCGALEGNLLAAELFGHTRGAFTGASEARHGLLEEAHRGTLFLDEIGNLPLDLQARLLRVLQERRVRPLGGNQEREIDVRVVAATNRDLARSVNEGRFRQDLYYRLAVVTLEVPPLRDRPGDVPLLVRHFAAKVGVRIGRPEITIAPEVLRDFERYPWPGNVRELSNAVERAVILAPDGVVRRSALPAVLPRSGGVEALDTAMRRAESDAIRRALRASRSRAEAARRLGISRRALYDKLARLGLDA